ncbi:hypothetical protein F5Y13DRAFT_109908 [Hypoxylon sp. FL1857]|nr:hypothetical protein F5Y13DRAFT_109908 [Hypoxylon sp. FL1857]
MTPKPAIAAAAVALLIASFINAATAAAYEDLAALDDAALFSPNEQVYAPGLGPRWYAPGVAAAKAKRQGETALQCDADHHGCLEVGPAGADRCCSNDQYCYVGDDWIASCCGLGTTCGSCPAQTLQYCNSTVTSTSTIATSGTVTAVEQTSVTTGCCSKPCNISSFLCQAGFGSEAGVGPCCPYGASCATGGSCAYPASSTISTIVTPVPSGCTTSQISCPTGGGCCNIGSTCVESTISGTQVTGLCAANLTVVETGGLSEGARVGIGVGVAVGAAIVIGAITWFWITRRRKARSQGTLAGSGADGQPGRMDELSQPFVPPTYGANTDIASPSSGMGARPRPHETGLAYDYYGPDAIPGPYTDSSTVGDHRSTPGYSDRAVIGTYGYPNNPNDIVRPVELDAEARAARAELEEMGGAAGKKDKDNSTHDTSVTEAEGPFELVGSPPTSPPPMTAEEAEQRRSRGLSPSPEPHPNGQEGKK